MQHELWSIYGTGQSHLVGVITSGGRVARCMGLPFCIRIANVNLIQGGQQWLSGLGHVCSSCLYSVLSDMVSQAVRPTLEQHKYHEESKPLQYRHGMRSGRVFLDGRSCR